MVTAAAVATATATAAALMAAVLEVATCGGVREGFVRGRGRGGAGGAYLRRMPARPAMPIANLLLLLPANPTAESRRRARVEPPQPPAHRRGVTPDPPAVPPAGAEARWFIERQSGRGWHGGGGAG